MTLQEIEAAYRVENGVIKSPGKFEGEPVFAPHFWQCGLEGLADDDNGRDYVFRFKAGDFEFLEFPTLKKFLGRTRTLRLREDSVGFVRCF